MVKCLDENYAIFGKGGIFVKRILSVALILILLVSTLVLPASAANAASRVDSYCTIHANGDCQVTLTVTLRLDSPQDSLTFPLPAEATGISVNGAGAKTTNTGSAVEVDLTRLVSGMLGEMTVRFDFTLPDVVKVTENRTLQLELPLLSGFSYPVERLSFVVVLPGNLNTSPRFHSTYRQDSIDSALDFVVNENMITGASKAVLNDHEAVIMTVPVPTEMFPGVNIYVREGNPELVPMLILAGAALLFWLLFMGTLPIHRIRFVTVPQGISAGELGCRLTLSGGDLTCMVMSWAQLGYIMIQLDEHGRVLLHKRMDMGNERCAFERKVFKMLFSTRNIVDATGQAYAKLCRKVIRYIPLEKTLGKGLSLKRKIFRILLCASHVFCGICVAMNMTGISILQILLSIALGILGAVTSWLIQEVPYRTHLRGKVPVYIGGVCMLIWIILGLLAGQVWIPLGSVVGQLLLGYFAAYGGRRTDTARQDACQILGLRHYLKTVTKEELDRIQQYDPEFFFQMAPFALALGVIKPFAKNFDNRRLDQCPYIVTRVHGRRTAAEWAMLLTEVADAMDERHRQMMVERWTAIHIR